MCTINGNTRGFRIFSQIQISFAENIAKASLYNTFIGKVRQLASGIIRYFTCVQSKGAKIRNRYNQVPHLTHDTNGKVTYSQLDTTNESQEVSPFPAGGH